MGYGESHYWIAGKSHPVAVVLRHPLHSGYLYLSLSLRQEFGITRYFQGHLDVPILRHLY